MGFVIGGVIILCVVGAFLFFARGGKRGSSGSRSAGSPSGRGSGRSKDTKI